MIVSLRQRSAARHARTTASALLTLFAGLLPAYGADSTLPLEFAPGMTSARVTGTVRGYDTSSYTLGARSGQTMTVTLASSSSVACIFDVEPPQGAALFNGSVGGSQFTGRLPAHGTYTIDVYQMRAAILEHESCAYTLTVGIE